MSAASHELVADSIRCAPHGEIRVKGIDRAINTYWVAEPA